MLPDSMTYRFRVIPPEKSCSKQLKVKRFWKDRKLFFFFFQEPWLQIQIIYSWFCLWMSKCICFCQILLDPENAKCSICLNVWHDVVTVAPCLHNFWSITKTLHSYGDYLPRILIYHQAFSHFTAMAASQSG